MKSYNFYKSNTIFEADISVNGQSYLIIYGKHINGYFCCIPNWNIGCEMAEPIDTYYNANKLNKAGIRATTAEAIAKEIYLISKQLVKG